MNVGVIGCGLIGKKRAMNLDKHHLRAVADSSINKAYDVASGLTGVRISSDWHDIVRMNDVDIVIVSTPNYLLAPIALEAIEHCKHVLVEKPVSISSTDILTLIEAQKKHNVKVKIGYNIRNHPSIIKAKELINAKTIGELMFIKGHYGNGSRLGFEKEWRSNPQLSGGGCLIDLGVHLIDLSRMFLGDFTKVNGSKHTYFWKMQVEDNAFLHLETKNGNVACLSCSYTEWKNTFLFEIYGKLGKIKIEGLGSSYGIERLTYYRLRPQLGPPITTIWEYPFEDESWRLEMNKFVHAIKNNIEPDCNLVDALEIMKIVEHIYMNQT